MQAIMVSEAGGPEVLRVAEVDIPRPGRGEVLVRVLAAGVGPWDAYLRSGGWSGPWPYTPGAEFAGLVEGHTGDEAGTVGPREQEPHRRWVRIRGTLLRRNGMQGHRLTQVPTARSTRVIVVTGAGRA